MANYKRTGPRTKSRAHYSRKHHEELGNRQGCRWALHHHPRWWDIVFHTRPKRRAEARELHRLVAGHIDLDAGLFPLAGRRPHHYFW